MREYFLRRRFNLELAVVIIVCHLYYIWALGATFWFDSYVYVSLGEGLRSWKNLQAFYQNSGIWFASHIQPGVPLVWLAMSIFPQTLQYPFLVLLQHGMAACATFFAFSAANTIWPSRLHLLVCFLLSALPFYQSLHNALLTESISSSLLLTAFALSVKMLKKDVFERTSFLILLGLLFVVGQFRSYLSVIAAFYALIILFQHRIVATRYLIALLCACVLAATAFPVYRYVATRQLFMPGSGLNSLMAGLWVNPHPSEKTLNELSHNKFPPDLPLSLIVKSGLDYGKAKRLGSFWQATEGLKGAEINKRAEHMGYVLRSDGVEVLANRLIYAATSCGSLLVYKVGPKTYEVFRGMTMEQHYQHQRNHYSWLSGLDPLPYQGLFDTFFKKPVTLPLLFTQEAQRSIVFAFEHYLSDHSRAARDPLLVGRLLPDCWVLLAAFSALVSARIISAYLIPSYSISSMLMVCYLRSPILTRVSFFTS